MILVRWSSVIYVLTNGKDRLLPSVKVHRGVGVEGRKFLANFIHKMRATTLLKKHRLQRVYT